MENLSNAGRIFYGIALAGMGSQTIYHKDFPYMLIPPYHSWIPWMTIVVYTSGALLILAGICIVFELKIRTISLLLGGMFLLIFCFYFIPYEIFATPDYLQLGEWENAEKELALSSGAFVVGSLYPKQNGNLADNLFAWLVPYAEIIFSITIISFGIDHFLYSKNVSEYISPWIPLRMFWTYFAGAALIGSALGIILKIKVRFIASLLGAMIFTWFIILHIPKAIASPAEDLGGEVTSAFLALGYSGISFVIAGNNSRSVNKHIKDNRV